MYHHTYRKIIHVYREKIITNSYCPQSFFMSDPVKNWLQKKISNVVISTLFEAYKDKKNILQMYT